MVAASVPAFAPTRPEDFGGAEHEAGRQASSDDNDSVTAEPAGFLDHTLRIRQKRLFERRAVRHGCIRRAAEDDPAFRAAYVGVSLSLADGQALVWGARLIGTPVPEKVSGSDLVWPLMQLAAAEGWRVYLVGGAPGAAEAAATRLEVELGIRAVGVEAPRISVEGAPDEAAVIDRVRRARPDVVLVGLGSPKQERFIHRALTANDPEVWLGVGASIDFLAGRVRRAPRWVSRAGLEWLFRLSLEPRRLAHRYLVKDPRFLAVLARTAREPISARVRCAEADQGRSVGASTATDR